MIDKQRKNADVHNQTVYCRSLFVIMNCCSTVAGRQCSGQECVYTFSLAHKVRIFKLDFSIYREVQVLINYLSHNVVLSEESRILFK